MFSPPSDVRFCFRCAQPPPSGVDLLYACSDLQDPIDHFVNKIELETSDGIDYAGKLTIQSNNTSILHFQFAVRAGEQTRYVSNESLLTISNCIGKNVPITGGEPSNTTICRFKLNYQTYFGQNLFIVGSCPELGYWDPEKAVRLIHRGSSDAQNAPRNLFSDTRCNWQIDIKLGLHTPILAYRFFVKSNNAVREECGNFREVIFAQNNEPIFYEFSDGWRWQDTQQNILSNRAISSFIQPRTICNPPILRKESEGVQCIFKSRCSLVGSNKLKVVGSIEELSSWSTKDGIELFPSSDQTWSASVIVPKHKFPFEYKFLMETPEGSVIWEEHENRFAIVSSPDMSSLVLDCWYLNFPNLSFHGASIFINVRRVNSGKGACTFDLLKSASDFCAKLGFRCIHISNIFDCGDIGESDGLPITGYALDPSLLDLSQYGFNGSYNTYKDVVLAKVKFAAELYRQEKNRFQEKVTLFAKNPWVSDYIRFYEMKFGVNSSVMLFVQCLLYAQLEDFIEYTKKLRIAVCCDIPYTLSINSIECSTNPSLFLGNYKLAIPPNEKNVTGTVLNARPFNFSVAFEWFYNRIQHFSGFFPMIRLQSTICFFRQWIVPDTSINRAVIGRFEPSSGISYAELETRGLWDIERYVKPFVRQNILEDLFGQDASHLELHVFEQGNDGVYTFKTEFKSESGIIGLSKEDPIVQKNLLQLLHLREEVILIQTEPDEFAVRPIVHMSTDTTQKAKVGLSFQSLPPYEQDRFSSLSQEYSLPKQKILWSSNGRRFFEMLSNIDCLFLSDASGIDGEVTDEVLQQIEVLPLRVQTEPRLTGHRFDDIRSYPYLSVATPTKDHLIRTLWEKDPVLDKCFWEDEFWEDGHTPVHYTNKVAKNFLRQHCWSNSMFVLFTIDSLPYVVPHLVRSDLYPDGILNLEEFVKISKFHKIRDILTQSQRAENNDSSKSKGQQEELMQDQLS